MRALIKLVKYYPILVNIYILIIMLTYVSGVRINVSTYLYTYIGHSFYVDAVFILLSIVFRFLYMAQNINCEHDVMLSDRNINEL